jgi:predicted  nucleic acid-binding Zn-ribbon protein
MGYENDLNRLEKVVERLMTSLDAVQHEKNDLLARVRQLEEEKKGLQQDLLRLNEDKDQIKKRVNSLIGSIEKWEKNFVGGTASPSEGGLFSVPNSAQETPAGSA